MEDLSWLPEEVQPVNDLLMETWRKIPDNFLEEEQGRLRERLLDIGGRLVAITQVREEQNEHTIPT